jgi:hypothetical protein
MTENDKNITAYLMPAHFFDGLVACVKQMHENGGSQREIAGWIAWALYEAKGLTNADVIKLLTEEELADLAAAREKDVQ